MNTKSNLLKSIFISLILVMGVNNAWASDFTQGTVVYFDNTLTQWSNIYLRVGHGSYNSAYSLTTKVNGTNALYKYTIPSWGGYSAFSFANNAGETGGKTIYQPSDHKNTSKYPSGQTTYFNWNLDKMRLFIPKEVSNTEKGCTYYTTDVEYDNYQRTVTITSPTNGSITVTYKDESDNSQSETSGNFKVAQTCIITVTATPNSGYELSTLTVGGSNFTSGNTYIVRADATIAATFTKIPTNSLTVKEGTGIASVTGSKDPVTLNSTYPITATPKTGYTFNKWTADPAANATFGNASSANTNVTVKNGAVTVTASATENLHNVTVYYKCGDETITDNTAHDVGEVTSQSITATTIDGYVFSSWTLGDGLASANTSANPISVTTKASGNYTLTANYTAKPYYIGGRFQQKWNDGSSTTNPFAYAGNGRYKLETRKTVAELSAQITESYGNRDQFFFIHTGKGKAGTSTYPFWTTKNGDNSGHNFEAHIGESNAIELGCQKTNWNSIDENRLMKFTDATDKSSDVVIWWEPSTNKLWYTAQKNYKVTYGVGNNKGTDAVTTNPPTTSGELIDPSISITFSKGDTEAGYKWNNWNSKADGTGTNLGEGDTYVSSNRTGDITVYACYDLITYNITYNLNGGTGATNTTYNVTSNDITLPTTPTKTGYKFSGWYDNEGCTGEPITTIPQGSTGDKTFYAQWTANTYTITYNDLHGVTHSNPTTYTIESETITFTNPTSERTGYTFAGWNPTQIAKGSTGNQTVTAQWTEITYTVNISTDGNGSVSPSGNQKIGISGMEVTATPTDPSKFRFAKWEASDGIQVADNYGATTTITATADGEVIAHFEELQPKTIYLKTVEGTTDGYKWFIKYGGQEYEMTPLGCTGEYYRGEVPEQTEFQLIAKDDKGGQIAKETRDGLVVPDNSNMLNLVSLSAGGNKIFFKPNSAWLTKIGGKTPRFTALFDGNGDPTWVDLTDENGDGIYGGPIPTHKSYPDIRFCSRNPNTTENNWNNKVNQQDQKTPTDGTNLYDLSTGKWSTHADTPVNGEGEWTIFEGATYRITFNHEGATSGTTTPGVAYVDAQYNSSMPTIESLPKNTDWKFAGYYYTAANGGTAITNAFGDWLNADGYISNGKWVKEQCVELYAHWVEKTPEITNVALSKNVFDVGSVETVTATPTVVRHSYQGNFTICWKLLDNSGTVMDLFPFTPGDNNSVSFSVDGLTSGTYTVRASIYASACNTGEELSRFDAKITIVSGYKVTVKYLCGDNAIQAPSIAAGHASTPVEITAPEIGGYKFVNWELGDGIFSESDLSSQTISYTAIYDGYLTAKYEKKKLIFLDLSTLPNKDKWTEPHIYLYSGKYWDENNGTGAITNCVVKEAMTKVPNTENIWYYDYEDVKNFNGFVAFTSTNKKSQSNFWDCEAIYRTDFSSGTPVFVPADDQEAEIKNNKNSKNASYYSKGYWVKYMDGTGYWLIIYNAEGNKELVRREFTSDTQRMTMTSIVDLEAEHTYQYEIYRNDGYYYKGGDITYTNSSTYRPLNEANKHSIKTTETGDYTFTLDYFTGDLQIKVQYPGEVGDYRILYNDDVRDGRYKPSQIISKNNKEPLVSFFVRPNNNPVLKIQKATLVTEEEVKWDNNVLYLTPNSNWKADGARFAAAFLNSGKTQTEWVSMTSIKKGEYYGCAIPAGTWKYVIFCRMNGSTTENNWENKWDQTNDLTIPTNGNNQYTVAAEAWSNGNGTWSKHNNDIIDLSTALKKKLGELDLTSIKADTGTVFNIHLSNNSGTPTIEKVALYTGNYYIRVDAVDGKWYDYKTNPDNLMTYSAFSESKENSFGEKFSHYKTKWCTQGMNVKFVIANDYSLCISDTLTQDEGNPFDNIETYGNLSHEANIRFMWNRHTNKVSRAYVAGASGDNTRFLVLKANQTIKNESGQPINNNEVVFKDTQNWLYERTIKVQTGTLVKLIAYYPDGNKAQYFRGTDANGFVKDESAVQILGGTSTEWYTMRIIYDFKTNRLMAAWVPDQNINGTLEIDADIMVIRQHQEDATYITFANNESELTKVKTVYGVMRFNRWTLNNRSTTTHDVLPVQNQKSIYERALYFISFPFDVHLSDVFGFGTYGTHWVISTYNGQRRAKNGYFVDNCMNEDCTNWDYIWDPDDFTMKANQGYLLSLDLELMKSDNTSFWEHDIQQVELFFPSFAPVETIKQTSYTMPALSEEDYKCKHQGHEVIDSYWRCIGVPSFADYNSALTTDGTNKITWKPKGSDLPYLYEWNVSDNSLMVRAASTYRFRPTYAYLVQNGGQIHWSAVNATPPSNIVARRQAASEINNYEWKLTLSRNEQIEDQAFVRLSDDEQVTTEFDFNQDLSKEFNYGRSDIYTLIGNTKAAANSLPFSEQTTLIPLGLSIEYNGDYTIAMPDGTANIGVTLIDTESNTRTNLSAGMEYTLTLKKGDYNNRFFIEISPIQQTPTDIEYVTGDSNSQDTVRKVLIDNILYIVRDGQIFDARGARVK